LRSPREIAYRVRQELANLALLARPSSLPENIAPQPPLPGLPPPAELAACLNNTALPRECEQRARSILAGRIPVFGCDIETGRDVRWRRDYRSGVETGLAYFRRIPYLDPARAGDHKLIWEMNRHQHLALLAQAHLLSGDPAFAAELLRQLNAWIADNPFQRGINWASALEVAFRSLSWCWIFHLAGGAMDAPLRARFLNALYRHGLHLRRNLSVYFSPNTHLLGEAVALHALGRLFPQFPHAGEWRETGDRIVAEQLYRQVREDGSHIEQSTYYHVYALDMFLFHCILAGSWREHRARLEHMAAFLAAVLAPGGDLPLIGDDDGGRFFYPFGAQRRYGLATLATCGVLFERPEWIASEHAVAEQAAWWIGARAFDVHPRFLQPAGVSLFRGAGLLALRERDVHLLFDAGPFGPWSAGHSHSDTLALTLTHMGKRILIDPGTYSYCDPVWRDRFRGSAAHNSIRIDALEQAAPASLFAWRNPPAVRILKFEDAAEYCRLDAECAFSSFRHRRAVVFARPDLIWIVDQISGAGSHTVEQFWHAGEPAAAVSDRTVIIGGRAALTIDARLKLETTEGGEYGWKSDRYLHKQAAPLLRAHATADLPCVCLTVIDLRAPFQAAGSEMAKTAGGWTLQYRGAREARFDLRDFV
jgi:hypothetical protein